MPTSPAALSLTSRSRTLPVARLDPWKDDGNIVLSVQGTCFRVHRSVLSAYSEIFQDLFAGSRPIDADEQEFFEECPIIHLQDEPADVEIVLKALYDRSYPAPRHESLPFFAISAFLRLGDKYGISVLVDEAKEKLRFQIGSEFTDPDKLLKLLDSTPFTGISNTDPHNFQIMNLLQEMNLKAPLSLAIYCCVTTCPLKAVVNGYEYNSSVMSLSAANLGYFILVRNTLDNIRIGLVKEFNKITFYNCSKSCSKNLSALWTEGVLKDIRPLNIWKSECDAQPCGRCKEVMVKSFKNTLVKKWSQLASSFGPGSWEEAK